MTTYRNRREFIATLKSEMKGLTAAWTKFKRTGEGIGWNWQSYYINLRAQHIAYCMYRGKSLEQIEGKRREPNSWITKAIDKKANELLQSYQMKEKLGFAILGEASNG